MDRKSILIIGAALLALWLLSLTVDHFYPPKMVKVPTNNLVTNIAPASRPVLNEPAAVTPVKPSRVIEPSGPEKTMLASNSDLVFEFSSRGGGLKTVSLRNYPAIISRTGQTSTESNMATLNLNAPVPVLALIGENLPENSDFSLTQNGRTVTAQKTLANGLRIEKDFEIGSNYLFTTHVRFENTGSQAVSIPAHELVIGTSAPIGPLDDPSTLGTFWYNGVKTESIDSSWFANRTLGCIPGTPRELYEEGAGNVVWAAVHNQYFTLAAMPSNAAPRIVVQRISIPRPEVAGVSNNTSLFLTNGYQAAFWYPATNLPAHRSIDNSVTFYAGPKEYNRLATYGLTSIMHFGHYTAWFSEGLLTAMNLLHSAGFGYGVAIIVITIFIKLVFWPLTRAATLSQKRMQALQPQLKAISDKYKDDPVKKNQKTMEFMKEHKVSPLGSCLPTVIQIPVFFGFYWMLRNAIELRGVHFLWVHDLSQPDTVGYLPILGGFPINPLPMIMGVTQLWQAQMLPASPGMDPAQQRMMKFMPLMFIAMLYRMSSGLTLYWTVSNLLSIMQTAITKTTAPPGPQPAVVKKKK